MESPEDIINLTLEDIRKMKVAELRSRLVGGGLDATGKKSELVKTLKSYWYVERSRNSRAPQPSAQVESCDQQGDEIQRAPKCAAAIVLSEKSNGDNDESIGRRPFDHVKSKKHDRNSRNVFSDDSCDSDDESPSRSIDRRKGKQFALTFRDIEGTISKFDGSNLVPVRNWIEEVEECAILYEWSDMQTLVYAKKSLDGIARKFILSEQGINSFRKLKRLLLAEFDDLQCSAEIHCALNCRKLQKGETPYEYLLIMKELSRGLVDDASLIHYVLSGINDPYDKSMLCGANTLFEFKKRLRDYEKLKQIRATEKVVPHPRIEIQTERSRISSGNFVPLNRSNLVNQSAQARRCFNCGLADGHLAAACPKPKRSPGSCFHCSSEEHQIMSCPTYKRMDSGSKGPSSSVSLVEVSRTPYVGVVAPDNMKPYLDDE